MNCLSMKGMDGPARAPKFLHVLSSNDASGQSRACPLKIHSWEVTSYLDCLVISSFQLQIVPSVEKATDCASLHVIGHLGMAASISAMRRMVSARAVTTFR